MLDMARVCEAGEIVWMEGRFSHELTQMNTDTFPC